MLVDTGIALMNYLLQSIGTYVRSKQQFHPSRQIEGINLGRTVTKYLEPAGQRSSILATSAHPV